MRPLVPGMRLGRYRLVRQLAVGGMAEIYLASATGLEGFEKPVVIKRILPQHAHHPRYVSMFLDEARLAATLYHPNVVQVFDIGCDAGQYYFAMEYAHGEDVRSLLARAQRRGVPMPLGVALAIAIDVCRGLHYAHERRDAHGRSLEIVHRDVTPSNVIVTYDGVTKLLDFGVAKATSNQTATNGGTLKGKIRYLSPEQCLGQPIDRRSDVFALGILLFELTTGTRLFRGSSDLAILQQIAHRDAPAPSSRCTGYLPELERIVRRALARDPAERYPDALAVQRDLEAVVRELWLSSSSVDVAEFVASVSPRRPTSTGMFTPAPTVPPAAQALGRARTRARTDEPSVVIVDHDDGEGLSDELDGPPAAEIGVGSGEHRGLARAGFDWFAEPARPAAGPAAAATAAPAPPSRGGFRYVAAVLGLAAAAALAWRIQTTAHEGGFAPELAPPELAPAYSPEPRDDLDLGAPLAPADLRALSPRAPVPPPVVPASSSPRAEPPEPSSPPVERRSRPRRPAPPPASTLEGWDPDSPMFPTSR